MLEACRPAPVSAELKRAVLQSFPIVGWVQDLTAGEQEKVAALEDMLRVHKRFGVYDIRVIELPQAWAGVLNALLC